MAHVMHRTRLVETPYSGNIITKIISTVSGVISTLLLFRFVLVLLGANSTNVIVNFIYSLSAPLVAPFFGIFNYTATYGAMHFEYETLIALVVYSLIAWAIIRVFSPSSNIVD